MTESEYNENQTNPSWDDERGANRSLPVHSVSLLELLRYVVPPSEEESDVSLPHHNMDLVEILNQAADIAHGIVEASPSLRRGEPSPTSEASDDTPIEATQPPGIVSPEENGRKDEK